MERPIVLSPPPLDPQQYSQQAAQYLQPNYRQRKQNATTPLTPSQSQSSDPQQAPGAPYGFAASQFNQPQAQFPFPVGHTERQQSVGYNLQQEFETLTADLDLDLMHRQSVDGGEGPGLVAPTPSGLAAPTPSGLAAPTPTTSTAPGTSGNSSGSNGDKPIAPSLLAPSASKYGGFATDLLGSASNGSRSLLKDHTISPMAAGGEQSGLAQLLGKKSFLPPLSAVPSRPLSVNDFSNFFRGQEQADKKPQGSFYLDMIVFCNWIENLSPQDNITMIEYLCSNLPLDILLAFKSKLDGHLTHHAQPKLVQPSQPSQPLYDMVSPYAAYAQPDLYQDMDALNLNKSLPQLHHPKPKLNVYKNNITNSPYLFMDPKTQRPKSAEPSNRYVQGQGGQASQQGTHQANSNLSNQTGGQTSTSSLQGSGQASLERARSPTSHLFEKTNFLQLAAANNSPSIQQYYGNGLGQGSSGQQAQGSATPQQGESMDLTAHTALKLGALATINSRVALDSNRKHPHAGPSAGRLAATYEESINRAGNSSSVPLPRNTAMSTKSPPTAQQLKYKKASGSPEAPKHDALTSMQSSNLSSTSLSSASNSSMPADVSNIDLLNNIPAWLKLLRLHKYTECLKDIPWRELVELDNDELEARGVIALGARRKLLKAFQVVKKSVE